MAPISVIGTAGEGVDELEVTLHRGRGFGLQAEVVFFRAFGSTDGGLEATATTQVFPGAGTYPIRAIRSASM